MQTTGTRAYELGAQPAHSLSQRVIVDLFALVRSELQVTLVEFDEKARKSIQAGQSFGLASIFLLTAVIALGAAVVAGLATFLPVWVAALIVAALYLVPALVFGRRGQASLAEAGVLEPSARILDGLWAEALSPNTSREDIERRAHAARQDLDRTVSALAQKSSSPSPIRDAILSDMAITLAVIVQARNGRR